MMDLTRRGALGIAAGGAAAGLIGSNALAQGRIPVANVTPPNLPLESGASIRVIRPARFVEPDEVVFRQNAERFAQQYKVPVRVDFVGWEDLRAQVAVTANTGAGPDVVLGWNEDPHVYSDKLIELTDIAEYLGNKYGGWMTLSEKYGKRQRSNDWIGIPFGGTTGPLVYRISAIKEAGFDAIPNDLPGFLRLCQGLKKINKPSGFALGNAVGDGNGFAQWMVWAHGGYLVDEDGKVAINSKETIAALNYVKELYPNFVQGTLAWLDPSNNRAFAAQECFLTQNGVSVYFALKNDPATRAIAEDTNHAPLVQGLAIGAPQSATIMNSMVFKHTKAPNASKAFIQFMLEAEQYDPWLTGSLGYWSHPLKAYSESSVWTSDPKLEAYRNGMNNPYWSGYKGPITPQSATVAAEYIMVQMFSSVVSGQSTPEEAAREAERRSRRIYR